MLTQDKEVNVKRLTQMSMGIVSGVLLGAFAPSSFAIEVLTKDDFVNNVVKKEQLVKFHSVPDWRLMRVAGATP